MCGTRACRLALLGAALLALAPAACRSAPAGGPGASPSPPATGTAVPTAAPSVPHRAAGAVWPIETRELAAVGGTGTAVLRAIEPSRQGSYERLVLRFEGRYGAVSVRYVPVVRADGSGQPIALRGAAYLQVTVRAAAAQPVPGIPGYTGPTTLTPGYPTLAQVTISGDRAGVLSVGVGLGRVAGFTVTRMSDPDRLVLDVAEPPAWRMWPDASLAAAQGIQAEFEQGHQPWRGDPAMVAGTYALSVYGWPDPQVSRIGDTNRYRLSAPGSADTVTVRVVRPFANSRPRSICEITDAR